MKAIIKKAEYDYEIEMPEDHLHMLIRILPFKYNRKSSH